jgi:SPP1 gp7 family putative phage head morphogenesis protein
VYVSYLLEAYKQGLEIGLSQGTGFTVEDLFTIGVKQAIARKSFEHAALAVQTTRDQLAELVQQAALEGQSTAELAKAIREAFDFNEKVRSLRIARTEMTDTINDATSYALRREGYSHKQWSTVIDGRERPDHAEANGQVVGINQPFQIGGASGMYPGDPHLPVGSIVNCRCTLVGAGIPEDRIAQLGERFLRIHGSLENKFVLSLRKAFLSQRDRILSRLPR